MSANGVSACLDSALKLDGQTQKKMIAKYPGVVSPLDQDQFQEWLANATTIIAAHNAALNPELWECVQTRPAPKEKNDG